MNKFKQFVAWIFKSKLRLVIAVILIVIVLFGIRQLTGNKSTTPQYQTAEVEQDTIVSTVSASGTVLTANISNIASSATGVVSAVLVKDGDTVTKGQKIAEITLDSAGAQKNAAAYASYLSAKNAVESANVTMLTLQSDMFSKWDDFKILAEGDTYENSDGTPRYDQRNLPEFKIAENDWLASEAKYKNQQAVIAQSQAALTSSWLSYQTSAPVLTAPQAGTISNITIVPGMTLNSNSSATDTSTTNGSRVAVIRSIGNPLVTVNLSEIDVPQIKQGQKATVTVDALSDKTFTGAVVSVDRIGTTSSGVTNYPTIISLDTNSEELLPNMAMTANIILATKSDVLLIPSSAVQTVQNETFARVLRNGKEEQAAVETGLTSETQTEIISGLQIGDTVITGTTATSATTGATRSVFSGGFGGGGTVRVIR